MDKRDTKQAILEEALSLFATDGFEGVSVKQIANAVGIKDSSLYKHYKSKQEIFDTLLSEMNKKFQDTVVSYSIPHGDMSDDARQYGEHSTKWLKKAVKTVFLFFLKDPYASRFRHMLTIEQFKNNEAGATYRNFFIETALDYQAALFAEMIKMGYLADLDPYILAMQFYSPLFILLSKYDAAPEKEDEAVDLLMKNVELFAMTYQKGAH